MILLSLERKEVRLIRSKGMEIVKEIEKQGKQCEEEFGTSKDHLVEATKEQ